MWWLLGGTQGEKSWLIRPAGSPLALQEILGEEVLLPKEGHPDRPSGSRQGMPVPEGGLKAAVRLAVVGLGLADGEGAAALEPPPLSL